MKNLRYLYTFLLICTLTTMAQDKRGITIADLWNMERLNDITLSTTEGKIVFSTVVYNVEENKGNNNLYSFDLKTGTVVPFKNSAKQESSPVFSPDCSKIAYVVGEDIFVSDADGKNEKQVTSLSTGASGPKWSPDGKKIIFVSAVYPELNNDAENKAKDDAKEKSKVKASIFTELMYRHWNDWRGEKRSHLFMVDLNTLKTIDLTLHSTSDVPPLALGSNDDYMFSPDGSEIAFTTNKDKFIATSTNNDIYILKVKDIQEGKETPVKKISTSNGNDFQPVYSPDGKYIAYLSMERAGFEADKHRIMLYDRNSGVAKDISVAFDLSAAEIKWTADSKSLIFNAPTEIYQSIYEVTLDGKHKLLKKEVYSSNLTLCADGKTIFFKNQKSNLPSELFSLSKENGDIKQLTKLNSELLSKLCMNDAEVFWSKGEDGKDVQSVMIKPPFFDKNKKYPMIFLIHGGPQGHWSDDFHYRWNPEMFAAKGYVVIATNPRGSVGYGQLFTDQISGDWGGKAYTDLMNAYDYAIKNFEFIDKKNTFAAGASYGGYMINWIAGHTDRFNALVSHAGVFNLESMYGCTEELWFPEWEFGGTPWEKRSTYEKWSPHRYIHNCKTPVLVVHGGKDFRVPEEQAFQLFTSLQRLGIDSKFLYFPDETHFVSKPQNAFLWWNTLYDWFEQHKK